MSRQPHSGKGAEADAPRLALRWIESRATPSGEWRVTWELENRAAEALTLDTVWLPHGQFRGQGRTKLDGLELKTGRPTRLVTTVRYDSVPGSTVNNAFVILEARWRDTPWRVLARLQIEIDPRGTPLPRVERVTSQPIGVS